MQLIKNCEPKNVVLVHGENLKMDFLKNQIMKEFNIDCFKPANGETIFIKTKPFIPASLSLKLLKNDKFNFESAISDEKQARKQKLLHGVLLMNQNCLKVLHPNEAIDQLGLTRNTIKFQTSIRIRKNTIAKSLLQSVYELVQTELEDFDIIKLNETSLMIENIRIEIMANKNSEMNMMSNDFSVEVHWNLEDEELGSFLCSLIKDNIK